MAKIIIEKIIMTKNYSRNNFIKNNQGKIIATFQGKNYGKM